MRKFILSAAAVLFLGVVAPSIVHAGAQVISSSEDDEQTTQQSDVQANQVRADTQTQTPDQNDQTITQPPNQTESDTQTQTVSQAYVALGDSVAAGAGLAPPTNGTAQDAVCDRSRLAYPQLIAQERQTTVTNLACSGAKVDEGLYDQQDRNNTVVPAQIDRAFANGTPDLITITIGANDARWTQFIRDCYVFRCGSEFDDARAKVYRADLRVELYYALSQIEQLSGNNPPAVLLSGYYTPFADLSCVETNRVTTAEQTWLKGQRDQLNQAIQSVVPYFAFAQYVPLDFSGHELCSSDPWVQDIQDDAPFHPTADGQASIAQSFLTKLEN
ncbi:MAG TPA: SGNH/GDSL hydrolase family protein [Candidatus Saccharimonadales bacterium]|nr:SGNH/GDSL hydrolase family protein [Candidatus Saccharimonadales bacterium]